MIIFCNERKMYFTHTDAAKNYRVATELEIEVSGLEDQILSAWYDSKDYLAAMSHLFRINYEGNMKHIIPEPSIILGKLKK